ncbi:hypothetical protein Ciccas_012022 [Cichlidogyrus casuarinus]|uniref:Uncharacterized protein n=1 Tax=Cichlidogyrus casuarinus TaxID=1844966 RepID=A0ABD2PRT8_9PLAT
MLLLRTLVLTLLIVGSTAKCNDDKRSKIIRATWAEPKEEQGNFKYYEAVLYLISINTILNTLKVDGNVATFKENLKYETEYGINVSAVYENAGKRVEKRIYGCLGNILYPRPYYQDVMDKLAEAIARKLIGSQEAERDLSEELAQFIWPWSKYVDTVNLVISDDDNVFAGKQGRKKISESRPRNACEAKKISTAVCQEITLLKSGGKNFIFNWPKPDEYAPNMRVQVRFFYDADMADRRSTLKDYYFSSRIYTIDAPSTNIGHCELRDSMTL